MGLKGATKLYRQFFCVRHKNRRKLNQHSQLLFLKINLHLDNQTKYLNFLPVTSIHLVSSSVEMQRLVQTKVYYKLCYCVWKETSHKLLKVAAAKMFFLSVFIIDTTCFDECFFLLHVITGRHCFLCKFIVTLRFGETAMLVCSLKQVF